MDNRDLQVKQFLVAKHQNELVGFGRIRKHGTCDEFCSLGVIAQEQNHGIGKRITEAIIKIHTQPLYLVCIIPHYFEPFGFKVVFDFPSQMQDKLDYCTNSLAVPEDYVVMKLTE